MIQIFDSMTELLESVPKENMTFEMCNAFVKAWGKIHGYGGGKSEVHPFTMYPKIMVSVSGGADSDIVLDLVERIGYPLSEVHYAFFDTGLEFAATKRHLEYLEQKYGITIERYRAKIPVPLGVKKYGVPFLSKKISNNIQRLQKHGFKWEDKPFEELYAEYPRCKSALRWWCNQWGEKSKLNISNRKWLKEFMIANPPDFPISSGCCDGAKKGTAKMVEKIINPDLSIQGVRKAEGGIRSTAYKSCFDEICGEADQFRPIFWFKKDDKKAYEEAFGLFILTVIANMDLIGQVALVAHLESFLKENLPLLNNLNQIFIEPLFMCLENPMNTPGNIENFKRKWKAAQNEWF